MAEFRVSQRQTVERFEIIEAKSAAEARQIFHDSSPAQWASTVDVIEYMGEGKIKTKRLPKEKSNAEPAA